MPWWVSPASFTLGVLIPAALVLQFYRPTYIVLGTRVYGGFLFIALICGLAAFAMGSLLPSLVDRPATVLRRSTIIDPRVLDAAAVLSILAYVTLFRDVWLHPGLALQVIEGAKTNLRGEISTIPGVTTLVQMDVVYATAYSLNLAALGRIPKRQHVLFAVLLVLVLFRTVMWSERLALVEFVLPPVLRFLVTGGSRGRVFRLVNATLPALVLVVSFALFAGTEYFRSWRFYAHQNVDFTTFMLDRWIGYYLTSLNNGAFMLQNVLSHGVNYRFEHILDWIYSLPLVGVPIAHAFGASANADERLLEGFLNPEFNVFSGIYPVLADLGLVGGLLFLFAFGAFFGAMYRGFAAGDGFGNILYPTMFIALLELLRIPYIFSTRYAYVLLGCFVAYCFRISAAAVPGVTRKVA